MSWRCTSGSERDVMGVRAEVSEAGTYCENYRVIPAKRCRAKDYGYRSGKKQIIPKYECLVKEIWV